MDMDNAHGNILSLKGDPVILEKVDFLSKTREPPKCRDILYVAPLFTGIYKAA